MSPSTGIHNSIFLAYLVIVAALLVIAGAAHWKVGPDQNLASASLVLDWAADLS